MKMILLAVSLLSVVTASPIDSRSLDEITPQPVFPVPDPTPAEPCGLATRVCIAGADCASGFCNILAGASTGCCQDTQWPVPGPQPTPPPFEPFNGCPASVPLCIADADCGFSGYCNHTTGGDNFFGCCQFGASPSDGPPPFPAPVTVPAPTEQICSASITVCISDAECAPGDSCSHLFSNSDVFGCCHAGVEPPVPPPVFPTFDPFPFPDPVPTAVPVQICPAWIPLCISDAECGAGQECSHLASNSDVFGCCAPSNAVLETIAPFVPPEGQQQRCAAEMACLADADCETVQGRCEFTFGSNFGCCTPNF